MLVSRQLVECAESVEFVELRVGGITFSFWSSRDAAKDFSNEPSDLGRIRLSGKIASQSDELEVSIMSNKDTIVRRNWCKDSDMTYVQSSQPGFFHYDPLLFACNHLQRLNTLLFRKLDIGVGNLASKTIRRMRIKLSVHGANLHILPTLALCNLCHYRHTVRRKRGWSMVH